MSKEPKKILHEGKVYYTVPDAARYLGTNATKMRQILGKGHVDWTQIRANGKILVTAESLVAFKYRPKEIASDK
jgi:hypothetical protein